MRRSTIRIAIMVSFCFVACTNHDNTGSETKETGTAANDKKAEAMENLVSIVEIPTADFPRAVNFYQQILNVKIEEIDMDGVKMGLFPGDGKTVNVALVLGNDYKPSMDGTIVYLYPGDDLQITLDKIETSGGKVIVPKTEISPEMGYFAMFIDTEGNKLGLHSIH